MKGRRPETESQLKVEFTTLGTVDLRQHDGRVADDILRQPKRLALLASLALARPRGFHRRDTLLALFWPELDTQHARASLRKALYVLRQSLGADVLVGRGDEEVSLAADRFHCDAWALEAALRDDHHEEALELYRGDLLEGFHAGDASPAFDNWLDLERTRLRNQAAAAAWTLSVQSEEQGDVDYAVRWGRRAFSIAPPDEAMLRRLLMLLDRVGDRAGVLRAYDKFTAFLASEYEAEASPETVALLEAIRARTESSVDYVDTTALSREPTSVEIGRAVPISDSAGAKAAESPARSDSRAARWRGPLTLIGFFAAAALIPAILALRNDPRPPLEANRLAVAPFRTFDSSLEVWGEGIVDYLSRSLDGAGDLHTLSPTTAVRAWSGRGDVASATALGEDTGSGLVVFGAMMGVGGDSVRVSATVVDVIEESALGDIEIRGTAGRMDQIVDSLTVEVLRELRETRQIGAMAHTSIGSRSMPALKAFLQGEQALRRTAWDSAQALYGRAIELDSMFALAHMRFGTTQLFIDLGRSGWEHVYRAGELNRGLSRHDSLLVEAAAGIAAVALGRVPEGEADARAERAYQAALQAAREYPLDAEAWFAVGAVREQLYDNLGTTPALMAEAYGRAIELDSAFAPAYRPAFRYALDEGDTEAARGYARKLLSLNPPPATKGLALLMDRLLDPGSNDADVDRLLDSLPPEPLFLGWIRLWLLTDSTELGIRVARAAAEREHDPRYWFTSDRIVNRNLSATLAYRGHLREALEIAGTADGTWFQMLLPELTMMGVVPEAIADSAFHDWLEEIPFEPHGAKYVLWWWAARRDTASIARYIERRDDPATADALGALALARADTAEAIRQLEAWDTQWDFGHEGILILARLLAATGREDDALLVLRRDFFNDWPLPSRVVWRLERARLAERAGESDAALEDYRFVAEVWRYSDPDLQSYVTEAQTAIQRLRG